MCESSVLVLLFAEHRVIVFYHCGRSHHIELRNFVACDEKVVGDIFTRRMAARRVYCPAWSHVSSDRGILAEVYIHLYSPNMVDTNIQKKHNMNETI